MERPVPLRRSAAHAPGRVAVPIVPAALGSAVRRGAAHRLRIMAFQGFQPQQQQQPGRAPPPRQGRGGQQQPLALPQPGQPPPGWVASWMTQRMQAGLYAYYNTRSTSTDLRLFAAIYVGLMLTLACLQHFVLDTPGVSFWSDLYAVRARSWRGMRA
jgi:hypothetical protein